MTTVLRNKPNEERLVHLNLFSLEKRRLLEKLIECFEILIVFPNLDPTKLFVMMIRRKREIMALNSNVATQVHSDCTKIFFTNAVV